MREMDCDSVEQSDRVAQYLAGRLPASEAEAFEKHYLGCERCASALREAGEIRAALGKSVLVPSSGSAPSASARPDWGTLVAAAATVAIFVFGIRHLAEQPPTVTDSAVLRSGETGSVTLTATAASAGEVLLEWSAPAGAQTYRIEIVRSDGLPIVQSDTARQGVILDLADLPPLPEGVSILARVEALDSLGQVVARSDRVPLPR